MKERFEKKFIRRGPQECWLWTAGCFRGGYGCFWQPGQHIMISAHRAAYELYVGPIPAGLHVLHRCDVPACVNPAHLFLGTNADNVRDRDSKGRTPCGKTHSCAKLTEVDVLAIRADTRLLREIAETYGCHNATISRIKSKQRWGNLHASQF